MLQPVSHSRDDETPEAKARWFQSLTLEERADWLCEFTDFVLEVNVYLSLIEKRFVFLDVIYTRIEQ